MVERKRENGSDTFTILNDGFSSRDTDNGYVEAKVRRSDGEHEGHALFIDVTNNVHEPMGHYAPLEMDKQELRRFISFLQEQYKFIKE